MTKTRLDWPPDAVETLKGCLDSTLWDSFESACSSLDEYTSTVTSYIQFCVYPHKNCEVLWKQ